MPKIYISLQLRIAVQERAHGYCEYCHLPASFSPSSFNFEHIIPLIKNGKTTLENLAYSCGGCNSYKNDKIENKDPLSQEIASLFNPRTENWNSNFEWSSDDSQIIGITIVGRATVQQLKLNRESNVNLRKLLKIAGLHPPLF